MVKHLRRRMPDKKAKCRTCRFLAVIPNKSGKRVVLSKKTYACIAPEPDLPVVPASVHINFKKTNRHAMSDIYWPPRRNYMSPDEGTRCPFWEPIKGGKS